MSTQRTEDASSPAPSPPAEINSAPRFETPPMSPSVLESVPKIELDARHAEFAAFHEDYVRHYIEFADAKAGVCFGVISAVLGYLVSQNEVRNLVLNPAITLQFGVTVGALVVLLISAACAFAVIAPRLRSVTGEGVIFFGAVAKQPSGDAYIRAIGTQSLSELVALRLKHCFDISKVCARKYGLLKAAIWFALPGLTFALVATLLL